MSEPNLSIVEVDDDKEKCLEDVVRDINEKLDKQIALLNTVVENIKPMLDAIQSSPLARMFGMNNE